MIKRALILCLTLAIVTVVGLYIFLPRMLESQTTKVLADAGFADVSIGKIAVRPSGAILQNITLDVDGFSTIESVDLEFNWVLYILKQKIDSISISKIIHNDLLDNIKPHTALGILDTQKILDLPVRKISVELAQLNLNTNFGDIRVEAKALINTLKDGSRTIQAVIWARQYQLGFQIPISGLLHTDGNFLFESTFNEGKLNIGPVRISRLSGWAGLERSKDNKKETAFSMQLDSGSADVLGLPLQDISVAISRSPNSSNGVIRSGISGTPSILISCDWNQGSAATKGAIIMDAGKAEDIQALIKQMRPDFDTDSLNTIGKQPLLLTLSYLPERRFTGGPVPFDINLSTHDKKTGLLSGNVLLYPDSMEIKGSVFGNDKAVSDMMVLFSDTSDPANGKTLRIDFNLKNWLQNYMQDNQG